MAIPHTIQMQIIKERIKGKEGKTKLKEIEAILKELPGFNTGPYGEIKKWLSEETKKTKTKSAIKHQDWLGVKHDGEKQFVLVGFPNAGKSSLINKLSGLQTKIANYNFTTLKPLPGIVNINGADFQIVDLPGLVEGAVDNIGNGRRFIGIIKESDGIILMHDLSKQVAEVEKIAKELEKAEIEKPILLLGNKIDLDCARKKLDLLKHRFPSKTVLGISTLTCEGFEELKNELWKIAELSRVYCKNGPDPVILKKGATIEDFTAKIHRDLIKNFRFARVTGSSAKFPNQQVGLNHVLADKDVVELVLKR